MSPRYINELLKPLIVVFGAIFLLMVLYGFLTNEEYEDDDDTVTVTFNCTQVLSDQTHYQDFIVNECREIKKHGN
jgi:predicted lactoylglutathione lyase